MLGTLRGKVGRADDVRAAPTTAATLQRGMELTFWLAKAEAALASALATLFAPTAGRRAQWAANQPAVGRHATRWPN